MNKSPLKNFIKKPKENSKQINLYEFIQSRNESNNPNEDKYFSAMNNYLPNEKSNKRSKSEIKKEGLKEPKKKMLTDRGHNHHSKQRKNFLELNKKKLNGIKKKNNKKQNVKKNLKIHRKTKSSIKERRISKETLYIPNQDPLSDIVRVANNQNHKTKNSELISQTDVYIENESEYDIVNELKRDILIKDNAINGTSVSSQINTWGNITNPFDESHMNLINGNFYFKIFKV